MTDDPNRAPAEDLTLAEYQALAEFRRELRRFLRFSEATTLAAGLEPQQHQLMLAIKGAPSADAVRVTDLAERLQLKPHSVVELINRAEQRGLMYRTRDARDHRRAIVHLTAHGEETLRQLALHHQAELCQAGPRLIQALSRIVAATQTAGRTTAAPAHVRREESISAVRPVIL
jgi:DNA-binding MarR family transcriptional regulator